MIVVLMVFLAFVATILYLLFAYNCKVKLALDTNHSFINVWVLWLDPLIKVFVSIEDFTMLNIHLLNKLIYRKRLKKSVRKVKRMDIVKLADPQRVHVDVTYSFSDPFATGIACGVLSAASQFIPIESIRQTPDFTDFSDSIRIDASADVNLGSILIRYLKLKKQH